jgi:hypothetical protein
MMSGEGSDSRGRGRLKNWIRHSNCRVNLTLSLTSEKEEPPSQYSRGNLTNRTNDGGRMGRLKFLNIRALVDHNWMAMSRQPPQRRRRPQTDPQ